VWRASSSGKVACPQRRIGRAVIAAGWRSSCPSKTRPRRAASSFVDTPTHSRKSIEYALAIGTSRPQEDHGRVLATSEKTF
jgi:hypothetical protein